MNSKENLVFLGMMGSGKSSIGSLVSKKLNIKSVIYSDDIDAPAQKFCDEFIYAKYSN